MWRRQFFLGMEATMTAPCNLLSPTRIIHVIVLFYADLFIYYKYVGINKLLINQSL